jgi:hypothetical protein
MFEGGKYDDKGFLIKNFPLQAVVSYTIDLIYSIVKYLVS